MKENRAAEETGLFRALFTSSIVRAFHRRRRPATCRCDTRSSSCCSRRGSATLRVRAPPRPAVVVVVVVVVH